MLALVATLAACGHSGARYASTAKVEPRQQVTLYADAATSDDALQAALSALRGDSRQEVATDVAMGFSSASIDSANRALVVEFGPSRVPNRISTVLARIRPKLNVRCVLVRPGKSTSIMGDAGSLEQREASGEKCLSIS